MYEILAVLAVFALVYSAVADELSVSPKSHLSCRPVAKGRIHVERLESFEHQVNGTDTEHRFAGLRPAFVVFAVTTVAAEPRECPFHDPAFRKEHEALGVLRTPYDVETPGTGGIGFAPLLKPMVVILVVRPDDLEPL